MSIEIVPYDPAWPGQFLELGAVITAGIGSLAIAIEHVGSTAVPGLAAKPIIDIDVVIADLTLLPPTIDALHDLGYEHQGDLGIRGREAFRRHGVDVPRGGPEREWPAHYLYVCPQGSAELMRHLVLRDHLRRYPEVAARYSELKQALAEKFVSNREAYSSGKSEFIQAILRRTSLNLTA